MKHVLHHYRPMMVGTTLCLAFVMLFNAAAQAHEIRPAYLEIREVTPGNCEITWKVPRRSGMRLRINPVFPETWQEMVPRSIYALPGAFLERWSVQTGDAGLSGASIQVEGLTHTMVDVLIRIERFDGHINTKLLRASQPEYRVPEKESIGRTVRTYVWMGVTHILLGVDHLLFVLGLLLLVSGRWLLIKTITAFTAGHSISLALATLGIVNTPTGPLNAVIALSIVFLAGELVRVQRGQSTITIRHPWVVAFAFGLLHGLGFATALIDLGLPESAVPLVLFLFNVGVEVGQLLFILAALILLASFRKIDLRFPRWSKPLPPYVIGSIAAFWFAEQFAARV